MDNQNAKPPLGLAPPFVIYDERAREICEAILRILDPESTEFSRPYRNIERWALELHLLAKMMNEFNK